LTSRIPFIRVFASNGGSTQNWADWYANDSIVTIETEGVVGGTYLLVRPGSAASVQANALATIPSKDLLSFAQLIERANTLLNDAQGTLKEDGAKLVVALDTVTTTVSNANDVIAGIKDGRGAAGMLLSDDAFAKTDPRRCYIRHFKPPRYRLPIMKAGRGPAGMLLRDEALAGQVRDAVNKAQQRPPISITHLARLIRW